MYAQPETQEQFRAQLAAVIENAARYNKRVPPGVYAEYGYTLYKAGQHEDAIAYFRREQEAWPESSILMERLIANIEQERSAASQDTAASSSSDTSVDTPDTPPAPSSDGAARAPEESSAP